ncbi:MAG: PD-(D/E)XK nuclease family protein [Nitrospiria bacterium]
MNVAVVPPGADLIEEVISYLNGNGRDFSASLVVFPGKRPPHFLRKGLAHKIGSSFIPPVTFSIDEFIDSICERFGLFKKLETIDAVALLYDIHKNFPKPLGGAGFLSPDSFFPLGLKIYRDIEELTMEGVTSHKLKSVETYIAEGIPRYTEERLQSLTYFYEEFYKNAASLGFSPRSKRYRFAAEQVDQAGLDQYDRIIFAGFFALTHTEQILFRKLLSHDNTVFLFQQGVGLAEKLKAFGIPPEPAGTEVPEPEVHFYSSSDTHGQVLALGRVLGTRVEAEDTLDENTVIVLPTSDTLFPLLRQGLSHIDEDSYNVSMGYPLSRTPVFGFLNSLMELVTSMDGERIYIPDYLKFVLHPYTKNIYFHRNSETTRILFHTLEDELLRHKAKTFTTLKEIEGSKTLFKEVKGKLPAGEREATEERLREHLKEIHRITLGNFLSFENVGGFARNCIDILVFLFNQSPAKLHPLFHPFSESLITELDILSRSLMKEVSFKDRSSYFIFLRKYIATCHTPFPGTPLKGLQVLGALETRNLKFKSVFVLDANEEILPETKKEESLIPFRAREILGLPTYFDRDKLTAYYFDTLLKGAKDVHLFFIENDETERSRYVEKLLWERQKRDKTTDVSRYIRPIQYQVNLVNKSPGPIAKTGDVIAFLKDFTFSATALDRYLACPLKFYYASVLGLRPKEEISGDIERDELGNFIHAVLRDYFSEMKNKPLKEADMNRAQMDTLVEDHFVKRYGTDSSGALYLLKRQVKRHLGEFLEAYCVPLVNENAISILACEEKISVSINSFKLAGRIDEVEKRDDKIVIVDYKTGANQAYLKIDLKKLEIKRRESWEQAIGSLQLPFYIMLYSEKENIRIEELEALFLFLGRSKIGKEIELPLFNGASPKEVYVPLKMVILKLLQEITDPSVPFVPAIDLKRTCPACDYQTICGTQWILR